MQSYSLMQLGEIVVRILRSLRCVLFSEDYIVAVSGLNVDLTAGAEVGPDRLVLPTGRLACVQQFPMAFLSCEDINMLCILTGPNQISRLAGKPALVYKVQNGLLRIACLPVFSVQIILVAIVHVVTLDRVGILLREPERVFWIGNVLLLINLHSAVSLIKADKLMSLSESASLLAIVHTACLVDRLVDLGGFIDIHRQDCVVSDDTLLRV